MSVGRRRHAGRELALRALFQVDMAGAVPEEALKASLEEADYSEETQAFARTLTEGCVQHLPEIDERIEKYARGWTLSRMANIDRNVLRLAVYELLYNRDVHPSIVIDEAVELAKKYSTAESGRFVNGILGNLVRDRDGERGASTEE